MAIPVTTRGQAIRSSASGPTLPTTELTERFHHADQGRADRGGIEGLTSSGGDAGVSCRADRCRAARGAGRSGPPTRRRDPSPATPHSASDRPRRRPARGSRRARRSLRRRVERSPGPGLHRRWSSPRRGDACPARRVGAPSRTRCCRRQPRWSRRAPAGWRRPCR